MKPEERHEREDRPGVLPGTPQGEPDTGPGILPGTPAEERESRRPRPVKGE
jgi:hypothetical protein